MMPAAHSSTPLLAFMPPAGQAEEARLAGRAFVRMAAKQTQAEQQFIRDEHCLMRNE
jgi:hypothetical protein